MDVSGLDGPSCTGSAHARANNSPAQAACPVPGQFVKNVIGLNTSPQPATPEYTVTPTKLPENGRCVPLAKDVHFGTSKVVGPVICSRKLTVKLEVRFREK